MSISWNQPICERCWFTENPDRVPVRFVGAIDQSGHLLERTQPAPNAEQCCMCGWPTIAGIFIRRHPDKCHYPTP